MKKKTIRIREKTIQDFGDQWEIHGDIKKNFWSSNSMFKDHFGKLYLLDNYSNYLFSS